MCWRVLAYAAELARLPVLIRLRMRPHTSTHAYAAELARLLPAIDAARVVVACRWMRMLTYAGVCWRMLAYADVC